MDRVPAWAKYARQNTQNLLYEAVFWNPPEPYEWKSKRPSALKSLRIYEAHVGMVKPFFLKKISLPRRVE